MQFSSLSLLRQLLADLREFGRWRLWRGVIWAVGGAGLEGLGLLLLLPLLSTVGVTGGAFSWPQLDAIAQKLGLGGLLILWCGVVTSLAWFMARREVALAELNHDFVRHLRLRLHKALLGMDWSAFLQLRTSDAAASLTISAARVGFGLSSLIQVMAGLLLVAIHTVIAASLAPAATVLAVSAGAALAVAQIPRLRRMVRHGTAMGIGVRNMQAIVSEHLASMKLAKSHNAEATFATAFEQEVCGLSHRSVVSIEEWAKSNARQKIAAALLLVVVVWGGVEYLHIVGASLLMLIAVFARLLPAVTQVTQAALRSAEMLPAYGEIENLRRLCVQSAVPVHSAQMAVLAGTVRLRGVGYVWPGRDRPALSGINLDIAENRTTALIGPSGAGKSTLADLCLGLLEPSSGGVEVGGVSLRGPLRAAWRQSVAVVPQEVFLFHDTVRNNLLWANAHAEEAQLWNALEAAAVDGLIRSLPQGLDTLVGDRGIRLSGGERQRLALARALLRRPAFLVLDEATSHLDYEHERMIQESLNRMHGQTTVLVIAHRLSTVRNADLIAVIDGGRVIEQGTWTELQSSGGFLSQGQ